MLPNRVQKPLMLIYKKLLLRPCKMCKIELLLSSFLTSTHLTAVAERNKAEEIIRQGGVVQNDGKITDLASLGVTELGVH